MDMKNPPEGQAGTRKKKLPGENLKHLLRVPGCRAEGAVATAELPTAVLLLKD